MDDIERMCREAEIVRNYEVYSGTHEYRATQAQLAMLVHLTKRDSIKRYEPVIHTLVAHLEKSHRPDQHNPYSARELWPDLFAAIDAVLTSHVEVRNLIGK